MKIIISSCDSYLDLTVPLLLSTLRKTGFKNKDILIAVNSNIDSISTFNNVKVFKYNSYMYEHIAFKACLDIKEDMFFLHDTCEVLPKFKETIESFPLDSFDSVMLTTVHTSTGIGFYKYSYIKTKENFINSINKIDKKQAISLENTFFGGNVGSFGNKVPFLSEPRPSPYKGSSFRTYNLFNPPGIIKYCANWGTNNNNKFFESP